MIADYHDDHNEDDEDVKDIPDDVPPFPAHSEAEKQTPDLYPEVVHASFGNLTTLKTLRSRPKGLRLSELLVTLVLLSFSSFALMLEPLAVLLSSQVTTMKRRKNNILADV